MPAPYMSETAKVQDRPEWMKYIKGRVIDLGCGGSKITPDAIGVDGRPLPGVDIVCYDWELHDAIRKKFGQSIAEFDTVFSSHFLEHLSDQWKAIWDWSLLLKRNGILFLYLPDGRHYNNQENPEHMIDMNYDQFMFWFRRVWCGESHDFQGKPTSPEFKLIDHGMDVGPDRYSFYVIAQKIPRD